MEKFKASLNFIKILQR